MALFSGYNTIKPDSRSRIGALQIGEHESPAEDWVTDPTLPVVLKNPYGGPGYEDVVIPMGRLVAVAEPVKVYTGKYKTVLTLANGENPVVGVAPYNFTKDYSNDDRFGGNKPAIITNKYIRLPYIPSSTDSAMCPWGHVTGDGITVGDYLKPTANGQFTKWTDEDDPRQIVGQILAKDFNQEMMGWLKMAMWAESMKYDDEIYQNFYKQVFGAEGNGNNMVGGYGPMNNPYFPQYRDGTIRMDRYGYLNDYQTRHTGIPGLTDGAGRALTRFSGKTLGTIPADTAEGTVIIFQIKDEAGNNAVDIINSTDNDKKFVLKVGGAAVTEGDDNGQFRINYATGQVQYKTGADDAGKTVTADYCLRFYGTPSYIDFKGCIGVFNVLLKM